MEYLRTKTVTMTGAAVRVFPAGTAQPKVTQIIFSSASGTVSLGSSSGVTIPTGTPIGTTPLSFRARGVDVISSDELWLIGTAALVVNVSYLEAK